MRQCHHVATRRTAQLRRATSLPARVLPRWRSAWIRRSHPYTRRRLARPAAQAPPRLGPRTRQIMLIGALTALTKVRSNHFYVSNFDPKIVDIDSWCEEIDRALDTDRLDDNECLSRIANCLKGEAWSWLNDWLRNDRTWTNSKLELKPHFSRRVDVVNILFEVMSTNSDGYGITQNTRDARFYD